ncbi:hypothetical protein MUK42_19696, partial [Musa troglodytarum]
ASRRGKIHAEGALQSFPQQTDVGPFCFALSRRPDLRSQSTVRTDATPAAARQTLIICRGRYHRRTRRQPLFVKKKRNRGVI